MRVRCLVGAFAVCLLAYGTYRFTRTISPLYSTLQVAVRGVFPSNGQYPGQPLGDAVDVRFWGSWAGGDENLGRIALGPFPAPERLRFAVGGYPNRGGNRIEVELAATQERRLVTVADVGERWALIDFDVPPTWVGQPVSLVALDASKELAGWLALSEPLRGGRGARGADYVETVAAWLVNGLLLGFLAWGASRWLAAREWVPVHWEPLASLGIVAAAGYLAFWIYFGNATAGKCFSLALLLGATLAWKKSRARPRHEIAVVAALMLGIGFFYLSLLHLFPSSFDFYTVTANRFRPGLPGDNTLPRNLAFQLYHGAGIRNPDADWLSSDRPPLQSGWLLLTWPVMTALDFGESAATGTAAVWFQLLWIPAIYGLLRSLALKPQSAAAWTASLSLTGFFLQNTVFTWPKLSAAAFVCGAFGLWVLEKNNRRRTACLGFGGALAALGWLSHGGAAFSLLAMGPWILRCMKHDGWRKWLWPAGIAIVFVLPWLAYQKYYDPPGNRLLKWHLGGQIEKDPRPTWSTIGDAYRSLTGKQILAAKLSNLETQAAGRWGLFADISRGGASARRDDEFFLVGRALAGWIFGGVLLPLALVDPRSRMRLKKAWSAQISLTGWTAATILVWCGLMFGGTVVHQGSYAVELTLFVLLASWLEVTRTWLSVSVVAFQALSFIATWVVANEVVRGSVNAVAMMAALAAAAGVAIFLMRAGAMGKNRISRRGPAEGTTADRKSTGRPRRSGAPLIQ